MSDNQPVTADITDANPVLDAADDAIGAAYDRLVTNNGSDRGDGGQFKSPNGEAESAGVADEAGAGAVIEAPAVAETPAPDYMGTVLQGCRYARSQGREGRDVVQPCHV